MYRRRETSGGRPTFYLALYERDRPARLPTRWEKERDRADRLEAALERYRERFGDL
ncbi:MAG: hypothetical protein Kow0069_28430 [Promethearchaeota archaeon]